MLLLYLVTMDLMLGASLPSFSANLVYSSITFCFSSSVS
nr:MAG TPA: hypothetical protein [Caudoviricetes sp.]